VGEAHGRAFVGVYVEPHITSEIHFHHCVLAVDPESKTFYLAHTSDTEDYLLRLWKKDNGRRMFQWLQDSPDGFLFGFSRSNPDYSEELDYVSTVFFDWLDSKAWFAVEIGLKPKCTCDLVTMMNTGCKCGAMQEERAGKPQAKGVHHW
jgi:hypothetical protein